MAESGARCLDRTHLHARPATNVADHGAVLNARYAQPWQRVEAFKAVTKASAQAMPNQQAGSFGAGVIDVAALLQQPLPAADALRAEDPA